MRPSPASSSTAPHRPRSARDHSTLRWEIPHLIEENAGHNGHIDILRELADGTTGD
jgi:hypothetical protein